MTPGTALAAALVLAYLCGSISFAYIAGRLVKGVDLRTVGSGNLGATNVYRVVGATAAVAVLVCDAGKGWVAAALIPRWLPVSDAPWVPIALGAAAVVGHAKPVFLLWRGGGKGVATGAGVFLALAPAAVGAAAIVFVLIVAATRYVAVASMVAALALPVAVAVFRGFSSPVFVAAVVIALFVLWTHRSNIQRLRSGTEKRIGRPGTAEQ
jgi:glycerol-3-phosphate acyltransferase PlsY